MKALSMKQPVPELILQGKKTIELRTWNTSFRGTFGLHASLNNLNGFDLDPTILPHSALVGTADLIDVVHFQSLEHLRSMHEQHLARAQDWFVPGKTYGFLLKNPIRFPKPIPLKGKLNFFPVADIREPQQ